MVDRKLITRLAAVRGRTAGSDAERRTAARLRDELRADGHKVSYETIWARPFWAATHAGHAALGVAGSVLSVPYPTAGLIVLAVTLVSMVGDLGGLFLLLRRLTPRRASQNVLVFPRAPAPESATGRVRLVLTARLDAERSGAAYRDPWVRADAGLRRRLGGHLTSPLGLATLAVGLLTLIAAGRTAGWSGALPGVLALVPTLYLVGVFAALVDIALSEASPGANADASAVATAVAAFRSLEDHPPAYVDVHLLLAGAGVQPSLGIGAFVSDRRRRGWRAEDVAVISLEPCGVGQPRYFTHEGQLWAPALHPQLVACARASAAANPELEARPFRSYGAGAAGAVRRRGWPALAIGALDVHDRPGAARQPGDRPEAVEGQTLSATLTLVLDVVARLDDALARRGRARESEAQPAAAPTQA